MNTTPLVLHGDALKHLRNLEDNSVDAIISDPPYGLSNHSPTQIAEVIARWASGDREYMPAGKGFMNRSWDSFVPPVALWDECLRVLKPGGHLACFSAPRTQDLMSIAIRLAGFEIRDTLAWVYGSGMPKSMNVAKAIDKMHGKSGKVIGQGSAGAGFNAVKGFGAGTTTKGGKATTNWEVTAPESADAQRWQGWGTTLKPAQEPIVLARKPLDGTVALNVLKYGTGGMNIDATRVSYSSAADEAESKGKNRHAEYGTKHGGNSIYGKYDETKTRDNYDPSGRWPTNLILSHSPGCTQVGSKKIKAITGTAAGRMADKKVGDGLIYGGFTGGSNKAGQSISKGDKDGLELVAVWECDSSCPIVDVDSFSPDAHRFFPVLPFDKHGETLIYSAKASAKERPKVDGVGHPTVKPLSVMSWLVRLLTPPGGVVLDPFAGSGTTLEAAMELGFSSIGIEAEDSFIPLIESRIERQRALDIESAA